VKIYGKLALAVSLGILIGCSTQDKSAQIQFLGSRTEQALLYADAEKADEAVHLSVSIYGLDKNTAFLLGSLQTPAVSIRSLLLLSEDGGSNWREVMTPVTGSDVIRLFFLNKQTGWALLGQTSGGPGPLHLYKTRDSGKSWKKVSRIPKRHYTGWPKGFGFVDERNGRIEMLYDGAAPTDGFAVMSTSDGGITWQETRSLPLDEYREKYEEEPEEPSAGYVTARDGSQWRLQEQPNRQISVLRRRRPGGKWDTVSTLPSRFGYSDGQVIPHDGNQTQ
jgi:hypothetical protein